MNILPEYIPPLKEEPLKPTEEQIKSVRFAWNQLANKYEPFAPRRGIDVKRYAILAHNTVAKTALNVLTNGIFWSDYDIVAVNNYKKYPMFEGLDIELIECIKKQIKKMRPSFVNSCKSIAMNSMVCGYAIGEFCWKFKTNSWMLDQIKTKPSWNFDFYTDEADNLTKIVHTSTGFDIEGAQLNKFMITCYPYFNNANYYGESKLEAIRPDIELLQFFENSRASVVQKLASKPVKHYYDGERTDEDLAAVQEGVFNMDSDSVLSLEMFRDPEHPGQYIYKDVLEVLDDRASPNALEHLQDIIEQKKKEITRHIGVPDDMGITTSPAGSSNYAISRNAANMLFLNISSLQDFTQDFVNDQIIPAMICYNYPKLPKDYELPEFKFQILEEDYFLKVVQGLTMLKEAGIITGKEDFLSNFFNTIGLPANKMNVPAEETQTQATEEPLQMHKYNVWSRLKKWIS
jgi:hypothetical protein